MMYETLIECYPYVFFKVVFDRNEDDNPHIHKVFLKTGTESIKLDITKVDPDFIDELTYEVEEAIKDDIERVVKYIVENEN